MLRFKITFSVPTMKRTTRLPVRISFRSSYSEGFRFRINHEPPLRHDFDQMDQGRRDLLASRHICASLNIKAEEERFRFGFAAKKSKPKKKVEEHNLRKMKAELESVQFELKRPDRGGDENRDRSKDAFLEEFLKPRH